MTCRHSQREMREVSICKVPLSSFAPFCYLCSMCRRCNLEQHIVFIRDKQSLAESSVFLCKLGSFFFISMHVCIKANDISQIHKFGPQNFSARQSIVVRRPLRAYQLATLLPNQSRDCNVKPVTQSLTLLTGKHL